MIRKHVQSLSKEAAASLSGAGRVGQRNLAAAHAARGLPAFGFGPRFLGASARPVAASCAAIHSAVASGRSTSANPRPDGVGPTKVEG